MEDKQQWLSIAAVVLVVIGLGVFLYRQSRVETEVVTEETQEQRVSKRADEVLERFKAQVPEDATRIDLKDVSGGEGAGVVTRRVEAAGEQVSIMVGLPDLETGEAYVAYLASDAQEPELLKLGQLRQAKGGFLLDTVVKQSLDTYSKVRIIKEFTGSDNSEQVVLEGDL